MEQRLEKTIMPFKIQQLVDVIIQKKRCSTKDAFQYLYSSNLYKKLTSESTSLWQLSTLNLYELLKEEKLSEKHAHSSDSKILLFQVFCLENYREYKNISVDDTLFLFLKHNVFDYLESVFEMLHTQSKDYIMVEIDTYLQNKKRSK